MIKLNLGIVLKNNTFEFYQYKYDGLIEKIEFVKNGEIIKPLLSVDYIGTSILKKIRGIPEDLYKLELHKSLFSIYFEEDIKDITMYIFTQNNVCPNIIRYFDEGEFKYVRYREDKDNILNMYYFG